MEFTPDDKAQRHVDKLMKRLLKEPGKWAYTSRNRRDKPHRIYVLGVVESTLSLMGLRVESDPHHMCRIRIKNKESQ